jgi:hypothetical protein
MQYPMRHAKADVIGPLPCLTLSDLAAPAIEITIPGCAWLFSLFILSAGKRCQLHVIPALAGLHSHMRVVNCLCSVILSQGGMFAVCAAPKVYAHV